MKISLISLGEYEKKNKKNSYPVFRFWTLSFSQFIGLERVLPMNCVKIVLRLENLLWDISYKLYKLVFLPKISNMACSKVICNYFHHEINSYIGRSHRAHSERKRYVTSPVKIQKIQNNGWARFTYYSAQHLESQHSSTQQVGLSQHDLGHVAVDEFALGHWRATVDIKQCTTKCSYVLPKSYIYIYISPRYIEIFIIIYQYCSYTVTSFSYNKIM